MKLVYKLALCLSLCLFVAWQIKASPFPQEDATTSETTTEGAGDEDEDEEEEEEEGEDVEYNEEEKSTSGNSTVVEEEEEEPDPDDIEDALAREALAKRLGIKNFSSAAIADKASKFVITYLVARAARQSTPRPRKTSVKKPSAPAAITTKKYRIRKTTELPLELETLNEAESVQKSVDDNNNNDTKTTNPIRKFVITVPNGKNGTGGGTIEINIPMDMMMNNSSDMSIEDHDHHISQMSISSSDEQGVKNIEAAIMEALLIAQQMTKMSSSSSNDTETLELDISQIEGQPEEGDEQTTVTTTFLVNETESVVLLAASPQPQQEVENSLEVTTPDDLPERKPTRRKRPKSTTAGPIPGDSLAVGPVTDLVVGGIRTGQLPTFLWTSIMKLASSKYAQIAVDAVECAVFYYCPNDEELGTLTKGAKFR